MALTAAQIADLNSANMNQIAQVLQEIQLGDVLQAAESIDTAEIAPGAVTLAKLDAAATSLDTSAGAGDSGKLLALDANGKADGRDLTADGAKLDGIEALADVTDLANVSTALGTTAAVAVATSAGAGDAGKLAKLDAAGLFDSSMIPAAGAHTLGGASHTADTLANLNALINDATLKEVDSTSVSTALGTTDAVAVATSAGAGDAGKLAKLDGSGVFDSSLVPAAGPPSEADVRTALAAATATVSFNGQDLDGIGHVEVAENIAQQPGIKFGATETGFAFTGSQFHFTWAGVSKAKFFSSGNTFKLESGVDFETAGTAGVNFNSTGMFRSPAGNHAFFAGTQVPKQTSGADLTNSVTVGGVNDTIDNWTDLSTYSTDAAAIRNAIYQLARKLKQVNDGLRAYSLLT